MIVFFFILFFIYLLFLVITYFKWRHLPEIYEEGYSPTFPITVIVPVRNEAENIRFLLRDLQAQNYPVSLLQVLVINDQSTDATEQLAKSMKGKVSYDLQVINLQLPENFRGSSKKLAITQAITMASGKIIVTTDGDCRIGNDWLASLSYPLQEKKAVFVAAPVTFMGEGTFFQQLQTIEFASLIVSGAVAIALNRPNMCNGANLAYLKEAFIHVKGYQGNEGIASGDDEFLLQKISRNFAPQQIIYQKSKKAVVQTWPQQNWLQFAQQRKRWAGKWKKHGNPLVMTLAIFIFLFNVSFIIAICYLVLTPRFNILVFTLIFSKILLEFILLKNALEFLNKKLNLLKFMVLQILYPFYVIYFGVAANFGSFSWKGRTYKN